MSLKELEIDMVDCCLRVRNVNPTKENAYEYYALANIKSVVPVYNLGIGALDPVTNQPEQPYAYEDMFVITINFIGESLDAPFRIDLAAVSNQAGWTLDLAGLQQAVSDICGWMSACTAGGAAVGLATAANQTTMIGSLATLVTEAQNDLDFEVKCVRDTVTGTIYMWRMEKDESTGTITVDFVDETGAVVVPPNPVVFCDATTILNTINTNVLAIDTEIKRQKTLISISTTGNVNIPVGASEVAVYNLSGSSLATVNGTTLPTGLGRSFGVKNELDTIVAVAAGGDTVLIDYMS